MSNAIGQNEMTASTKIRWDIPAALSATVLYFVSGNFVGWSSPTIPRLLRDNSTLLFTPDEVSWVVSLMSMPIIFIPIPTGFVLHTIGPKHLLICAGVPMLLSWVILFLANSAQIVMVARFTGGIGLAITLMVGPVYLGEIAQPKIRGILGTLFQVMMNLGALFEFCVGPYVSFRNLSLISAAFPIIFLLTFPWMPDSPYYLTLKGKRSEAEKSIAHLYGLTDCNKIQEEVNLIQKTVDADKSDKPNYKELFLSAGNRNSFLITLAFMFIQQFSGALAVQGYATELLLKSKVEINADLLVIFIGLIQLISSIFSSLLVDRIGRKPLLRISCASTSLSLIIMGTYFFLKTNTAVDISNCNWLPAVALSSYFIAYSLGLGPLPWTIMGEIFATNVKSLATVLVSSIPAVATVAVTKLYQIAADSIGEYVAFWFFASCCFVGMLIEFIFLPETKGKTFLEIQAYFHKHGKISN